MTCDMQMKERHKGLFANGIQSQIFSFNVSHSFVERGQTFILSLVIIKFCKIIVQAEVNES